MFYLQRIRVIIIGKSFSVQCLYLSYELFVAFGSCRVLDSNIFTRRYKRGCEGGVREVTKRVYRTSESFEVYFSITTWVIRSEATQRQQ